MNVESTRQQAIASVEAAFGTQRGMLRPLAWIMVVLLVAVHGIVTAVYLSGGASGSDFFGLNGICAPLTLGAIWFTRWTYRRGEAGLVDALRQEPPLVRGASFLEFRGRYGIAPGAEIQTLDGKVWRVKMHEPLVHDVIGWLRQAAARVAQSDLSYRSAAPCRPSGSVRCRG